MTDKQIIIDGVDVSGCKHYKNRTCIADYCLTDMPFGEAKCELNPNCYYKQLLRKEQECEDLKEKLIKWLGKEGLRQSEKEFYEQQLDQLKAENKELKNDHLQEVGQLKFAIGTLTAENLHLKELLDMRIEALCDSCKAGSMLPIKCRIYEKILAEIKEIAMGIMDDDLEESSAYYDAKQILQKISECEGNDGL